MFADIAVNFIADSRIVLPSPLIHQNVQLSAPHPFPNRIGAELSGRSKAKQAEDVGKIITELRKAAVRFRYRGGQLLSIHVASVLVKEFAWRKLKGVISVQSNVISCRHQAKPFLWTIWPRDWKKVCLLGDFRIEL